MSGRDGYSIRDYGWMINDPIRTGPFVAALERLVVPGAVVLDIGTGTGIFALLAVRLGASRVYAVEPDAAIDVARRCAEVNGALDRIVFLQRLSTDLDLPEKVDIVIGDLHGTLPFYGGNLQSLIDARRRHLKPDGRMIPLRDRLWAVPAHAPSEYRHVTHPWQENAYGVDFSPGRRYVTHTFWRAEPEPIGAEQLLAAPAEWGVLEYEKLESPDLDRILHLEIVRSGTMHGFYVWFDGEPTDGARFSNAPWLPKLVYGRTFFPVEKPINVAPGDLIQLRLSAKAIGDDYVFRWDTVVTEREGGLKAGFRQHTFGDRPIQKKDLACASPRHVPTLTRRGRIDLAVLVAFREGKSVGAIAESLQSDFPADFSDAGRALSYVGALAARYSE